MSFKENLKAKIKADTLLWELSSTMKEPPGKWWVDAALIRELLNMTDYVSRKFRDLYLYVRPLGDDTMEVLVFDNELAIYHTTVADVALRISPCWQEMFSIRNIKKIMNHKDVLVSKGKASLKRIHANAVALLDLTYTRDDLALLVEAAHKGLEHRSMEQVQESLDLFVELLDLEPLNLDVLKEDVQVYAGPGQEDGSGFAFEHLILFDKESLSLGLKKGPFSPEDDLDLAWVMQYAGGEKKADLKGMAVFDFLAELVLEKVQTRNGENQ